jgi:hypothetical protein
MSQSAVHDQHLDDLEAERDFLLRSLEDLEGEREAGDVSPEDYTRLRDNYTARAAEVLRAISAETSASDEGSDKTLVRQPKRTTHPVRRDGKKPGSKNRTLLVYGVLFILAGVVALVVLSNTSARLPGNTATGGLKLPLGQQVQRELAQAATLQQEGELTEALQLYQQVLTQVPGNAVALAQAGWLEFGAGVAGGDSSALEKGQSQEQQAVVSDPGLSYAHAYLGSMFFVEGEYQQSTDQYAIYVADKPAFSAIAPYLTDLTAAFKATKTPLPALVVKANAEVAKEQKAAKSAKSAKK